MPINMSINFLFVLEITLVFLMVVIFDFLSKGVLAASRMDKNLFTILWAVFGILLFLITYLYFSNKIRVHKIIELYENSNLNNKIKTWQIFMLPILILLLAVLVIEIFG